ncbi:prephenate dehydrogenase, partial [Silvibacterium sp.]|uniref:prephenate dehydrogenase n=1 Tax=Silvibacterium sp. TaxID=1964179 RepID=UPI0039E42D2F
MPIERIAILGTGLIGASAGLALRSHGFAGVLTGWDPSESELQAALEIGAINCAADTTIDAAIEAAKASDVILLSGPVFTILEWLDRLAPALTPAQLVTDVGSVKGAICARAAGKYNTPDTAGFLPGHPMAGKEVGGAANADGALFRNAAWLFT